MNESEKFKTSLKMLMKLIFFQFICIFVSGKRVLFTGRSNCHWGVAGTLNNTIENFCDGSPSKPLPTIAHALWIIIQEDLNEVDYRIMLTGDLEIISESTLLSLYPEGTGSEDFYTQLKRKTEKSIESLSLAAEEIGPLRELRIQTEKFIIALPKDFRFINIQLTLDLPKNIDLYAIFLFNASRDAEYIVSFENISFSINICSWSILSVEGKASRLSWFTFTNIKLTTNCLWPGLCRVMKNQANTGSPSSSEAIVDIHNLSITIFNEFGSNYINNRSFISIVASKITFNDSKIEVNGRFSLSSVGALILLEKNCSLKLISTKIVFSNIYLEFKDNLINGVFLLHGASGVSVDLNQFIIEGTMTGVWTKNLNSSLLFFKFQEGNKISFKKFSFFDFKFFSNSSTSISEGANKFTIISITYANALILDELYFRNINFDPTFLETHLIDFGDNNILIVNNSSLFELFSKSQLYFFHGNSKNTVNFVGLIMFMIDIRKKSFNSAFISLFDRNELRFVTLIVNNFINFYSSSFLAKLNNNNTLVVKDLLTQDSLFGSSGGFFNFINYTVFILDNATIRNFSSRPFTTSIFEMFVFPDSILYFGQNWNEVRIYSSSFSLLKVRGDIVVGTTLSNNTIKVTNSVFEGQSENLGKWLFYSASHSDVIFENLSFSKGTTNNFMLLNLTGEKHSALISKCEFRNIGKTEKPFITIVSDISSLLQINSCSFKNINGPLIMIYSKSYVCVLFRLSATSLITSKKLITLANNLNSTLHISQSFYIDCGPHEAVEINDNSPLISLEALWFGGEISLIFKDVQFMNIFYGGGVKKNKIENTLKVLSLGYLVGKKVQWRIFSSIFVNCSSYNFGGFGISLRNDITDLKITNVIFKDCFGFDGGLYIGNLNATVNIAENITFINCYVLNGGLINLLPFTTFTLNDVTVSGCSSNTDGVLASLMHYSVIVIFKGTFKNILSQRFGTALAGKTHNQVFVYDSTFSNLTSYDLIGALMYFSLSNEINFERTFIMDIKETIVKFSNELNTLYFKNVSIITTTSFLAQSLFEVSSNKNTIFGRDLYVYGENMASFLNFRGKECSLSIEKTVLAFSAKIYFTLPSNLKTSVLIEISYKKFEENFLRIFDPVVTEDEKSNAQIILKNMNIILKKMNSSLILVLNDVFLNISHCTFLLEESWGQPILLVSSVQPKADKESNQTRNTTFFISHSFLKRFPNPERMAFNETAGGILIFQTPSVLLLDSLTIYLGQISHQNLIEAHNPLKFHLLRCLIFLNLLSPLGEMSSMIKILFNKPYIGTRSIKIEAVDIFKNYAGLGTLLSLILENFYQKTTRLNIYIKSSFLYLNTAYGSGGLFYISYPEKARNQIYFTIADSNINKNFAAYGRFIALNKILPYKTPFAGLSTIFNSTDSAENVNRLKTSLISSDISFLNLIFSETELDSYLTPEKSSNESINPTSLDNKFVPSIALYQILRDVEKRKEISFERVNNRAFNSKCFFKIIPFDSLGYPVLVSHLNKNFVLPLEKVRIHFHSTVGIACAHTFEISQIFDLLTENISSIIPSNLLQSELGFPSWLTSQLNIRINISFAPCDRGHIFSSFSLECKPCEVHSYLDEFMFLSLTACKPCTELDNFYCYGADMRSPKPSFWRKNTESDNFLRCPHESCLGDPYFLKNISAKDCLNCSFLGAMGNTLSLDLFSYDFNAVGKCLRGYNGILCAECDEGFGKSGDFLCSDCQKINLMVMKFLFSIGKFILFFLSTWKALNIYDIMKEQERTAIITSDFVKNVKSSYLLKILFQHLTILAILNSVPPGFSETLKYSVGVVSDISPTEQYDGISHQCLLRLVNIHISPVHLRIIFSAIFFPSTCLLFSFILSCKNITESKKINKINLKKFILFLKNFQKLFLKVFLIIFMENITAALGPFVDSFLCLNVGARSLNEDFRVIKDVKISCSSREHKLLQVAVAVPVLICFGVLTPFYIFIKTLFAKKLGTFSKDYFLETFGFFIYPYSNQHMYFESIAILRKLLLVIFRSLFAFFLVLNESNFILSLFFLYLLCFYFIQRKLKPYEKRKYNILQIVERRSLALNLSNVILTIIWNSGTTSLSTTSKYMILGYLGLSNLLFIGYWLSKFFVFMRQKAHSIARQIFFIFSKLKVQNSLEIRSATLRKTVSRKPALAQISKENKSLRILVTLLKANLEQLEQRVREIDIPFGKEISSECSSFSNPHTRLTKKIEFCKPDKPNDPEHDGDENDSEELKLEESTAVNSSKLKLVGSEQDEYFVFCHITWTSTVTSAEVVAGKGYWTVVPIKDGTLDKKTAIGLRPTYRYKPFDGTSTVVLCFQVIENNDQSKVNLRKMVLNLQKESLFTVKRIGEFETFVWQKSEIVEKESFGELAHDDLILGTYEIFAPLMLDKKVYLLISKEKRHFFDMKVSENVERLFLESVLVKIKRKIEKNSI